MRFRSGGDAAKASATADEIIEHVRKLAREFDDAQIARILNRQGHRSGRGLAFTQSSVTSLRGKNHIPKCPAPVPRDDREGPFTADEAARELGVSMHTVHRWLRDGILVGQQATPRAPWRILLTEDVRHRLTGGATPPDWVGLDEAARRLGMPKSTVAHWVKQGKLPAMRTTVGKRACWRIDLSSAPCGRQRDLFHPMINADTKDGEAMAAAFHASGETLAGFARRHELHEARVQRWMGRVGRRPRPSVAAQPVVFAPVQVTEGPSTMSGLEVVVGGAVVRVSRGFDGELLRRVVATLGEASC